MWTKSSAWAEWGAEPPLPTSQNPNFATLTPAHWASWQPHQYVTPSTPQTGSGRKQLTGHKDGDRIDPAQASGGSDSEGNRMMVDSVWSSDRTVGKEQRTIKNAKRIRVKKEIRDLGNWVSMIEWKMRSSRKEKAAQVANPLLKFWTFPQIQESLELFPQIPSCALGVFSNLSSRLESNMKLLWFGESIIGEKIGLNWGSPNFEVEEERRGRKLDTWLTRAFHSPEGCGSVKR